MKDLPKIGSTVTANKNINRLHSKLPWFYPPEGSKGTVLAAYKNRSEGIIIHWHDIKDLQQLGNVNGIACTVISSKCITF